MFQPKGDRPEWAKLMDLFADARIGDVITYDELSEALGRDFRHEKGGAGPIMKVKKVLLEQRQKCIVVVRSKGYRVVTPSEQLTEAASHTKKGRRAYRRAWTVATNVQRDELTTDDMLRVTRIESQVQRIDAVDRHVLAPTRRNRPRRDTHQAEQIVEVPANTREPAPELAAQPADDQPTPMITPRAATPQGGGLAPVAFSDPSF